MIWVCDVPSVPLNITPNAVGTTQPADVNVATDHGECPANRHNYRTDVLFCDGHVEAPKRNDVRDSKNAYWRARWNNDNDPHFEANYWSSPSWINTLDQ